MPQPERFPIPKKVDLSAVWSCAPRIPQWDALWARLLSCTLDPLLTQSETKQRVPAQEKSGEVSDATSC
jgi:hypothetical protein